MKKLITIIQVFAALICHAAGYHTGGTLSGDNGLPHYQVNTIATDSKGYVWAGTRNGLSRYDGYSLRNYFNIAGDTTSLRHNYVRKVFIDSADRIWVLTIHGLSRYNPDINNFVNYRNVDTDMTAITETPDGRLLCGGGALWVYCPETDSSSRLRLPPTSSSRSPPTAAATSICRQISGSIALSRHSTRHARCRSTSTTG